MNVYEKLLHVQQKLKAPKSQYSKFGDFHYRSCEDIQEAVKPLLAEVKAVLLICDEVVEIGNRFYIKATAIFQDVESTECIKNSAFAREGEDKAKMNTAQLTGSCSSYARKYALNGLFCIDDSKQSEPSTDLDKLRKEAERTGTQLSKVCERYHVEQIEELTPEQCKKALRAFSKMPDEP